MASRAFAVGLCDVGLLLSSRLSKQQKASVQFTVPKLADGSTVMLRLVGERDGQNQIWASARVDLGTHQVDINLEDLAVGAWCVWLEWVKDGQCWPLGAKRNVMVVQGVTTASVQVLERWHGDVRGVLSVSSDGLVRDVPLRVLADVLRLDGGAWRTIEEQALLFEAIVDIPSHAVEIPFDLGERISSEWAHRLAITITVEGQDVVMVAKREELFLPVGDSGLIGGIPQIDIADETGRLTVIDHVPGKYLGHPDTVLLEDGQTILVVYPLEHGGPTVLRRSTDGGKTWSKRLPVPANWARTADVPTIFRLVDPEGTERLVVIQNMAKQGLEARPVNREDTFAQAVSLDSGHTWTSFTPTGLRGHVSPNTVVPISDGRYLTVFQLNAKIEMAITSDGGQTWHSQRTIATHPSAALTEPAAVKSPDGKEIAVLIRENSRQFNSMLIVSKDEGVTWSAPLELSAALTGDRHMPRYTPDGRLIVTFRDMLEGSPTYGDFVAWVGSYDDLVNLRPGQYRVRLLESKRNPWDTGYAGLELLPDNTFVSTTYVPLTYGALPSVVSLRFTMDELDARVDQQFGSQSKN